MSFISGQAGQLEAMMSRITTHLDNLTDVNLKKFCEATAYARDPDNPFRRQVDRAEAIRVMIRETLHDPSIGRQVRNRLRLHPGGETVRNAIQVDLDNQTGVELANWHREVDPAKAIQAMVRVTLDDPSIRKQVTRRLLHELPPVSIHHYPDERITRIPQVQKPERKPDISPRIKGPRGPGLF